MIDYAKFSSDNPSVYLLEYLQKQIKDDTKLVSQLHQLKKSDEVLDGVLRTLFLSWIGKPSNAGVDSKEFAELKKGYELLMSGRLWSDWHTNDEDKVCSIVLTELFKISNDQVMWYRFLRNLRQDFKYGTNLNKVLLFLIKTWQHEESNALMWHPPS
ncbi:hypothetical protein Plhal304r1_c029g0096021 [Plasmopara halstedii]